LIALSVEKHTLMVMEKDIVFLIAQIKIFGNMVTI